MPHRQYIIEHPPRNMTFEWNGVESRRKDAKAENTMWADCGWLWGGLIVDRSIVTRLPKQVGDIISLLKNDTRRRALTLPQDFDMSHKREIYDGDVNYNVEKPSANELLHI